MAEYIDRKRYMKEKYNCDLIHIESLELVPLYQIIDRLEQSIERSKIDNTIKEITKYRDDEKNDFCEVEVGAINGVLDILKRNIGE